MSAVKIVKDWAIKFISGRDSVPVGLFEMSQYFRHNEPIAFSMTKGNDGTLIVRSENFRFGTIVTSGKNSGELDKNIRDAMLTAFSIPSSYASEAHIVRQGEDGRQYALA